MPSLWVLIPAGVVVWLIVVFLIAQFLATNERTERLHDR